MNAECCTLVIYQFQQKLCKLCSERKNVKFTESSCSINKAVEISFSFLICCNFYDDCLRSWKSLKFKIVSHERRKINEWASTFVTEQMVKPFLPNVLFPLYCISKFTAIKTNLNVIYVTSSYLHKKFIYNLFKLQSHFMVSHTKRQEEDNGMLLSCYSDCSHWVWFLWILIKRFCSID